MLNGQKIIILGDFSVGERLTHSVHGNSDGNKVSPEYIWIGYSAIL